MLDVRQGKEQDRAMKEAKPDNQELAIGIFIGFIAGAIVGYLIG